MVYGGMYILRQVSRSLCCHSRVDHNLSGGNAEYPSMRPNSAHSKHSQCLDIISKADHADCLPRSQTDTRRNTSVQPFETVCLVNVRKRVEDGFLGWTGGVLALDGRLHLGPSAQLYPNDRSAHLDSDDLDWLIPSS